MNTAQEIRATRLCVRCAGRIPYAKAIDTMFCSRHCNTHYQRDLKRKRKLAEQDIIASVRATA